MKDNIKFQNGSKLTAKSVKESLEESSNKSDLVKGSLPIKNITAHGQHLTLSFNVISNFLAEGCL